MYTNHFCPNGYIYYYAYLSICPRADDYITIIKFHISTYVYNEKVR